MRKNAVPSELFDKTMLLLAQMFFARREKGQIGRELLQGSAIGSARVLSLLALAVDLCDCAYVPEYVDYVLAIETECAKQEGISSEEVRVLHTVQLLVGRFVLLGDAEFFREIFSHECTGDTALELYALYEKMR